MRRVAKASAPAKVILFGEHFVVHGCKALVTAIDLRAEVTCTRLDEEVIEIYSGKLRCRCYSNDRIEADDRSWRTLRPLLALVKDFLSCYVSENRGIKVEINSRIPRGAGLGSSAAVSVALAKALSELFELDLTNEALKQIAMKPEEQIHGMPSGIDTHITTYGGMLVFQRPNNWENVRHHPMKLIIIDSGGRRKTGKLVERFGAFVKTYPSLFSEMRSLYNQLFGEALKVYESGDLETLGRLMVINGAMLRLAGVSTPELDKIVETAMTLGVYGAKLTGAGGGGCVIALPRQDLAEQTAEAIKQQFPRTWVSECPREGVRVEAVL